MEEQRSAVCVRENNSKFHPQHGEVGEIVHISAHICLGTAALFPLSREILPISSIDLHRNQEFLHIKASRKNDGVNLGADSIHTRNASFVDRFNTDRSQLDILAVQALEIIGIEDAALAA